MREETRRGAGVGAGRTGRAQGARRCRRHAHYVISLDRAPERREHMRAQMARLGLTCEIVRAVDGHQPIEGLERLYDRRRRLRVYGTDLAPGAIACCLSHLAVCQRIIESREQIGLVLEDDVVLSDAVGAALADIATLDPRGFDVVRLAGLRERRGRTVRPLSGGHSLARLIIGPCGTQAYVITAAGAAIRPRPVRRGDRARAGRSAFRRGARCHRRAGRGAVPHHAGRWPSAGERRSAALGGAEAAGAPHPFHQGWRARRAGAALQSRRRPAQPQAWRAGARLQGKKLTPPESHAHMTQIPVAVRKMPETADRRLAGHRFAPQINAGKPPHRQRIVQRLFSSRVRQVEPLLQAVNPQHPLQTKRPPASLTLGIKRLNQPTQLRTTEPPAPSPPKTPPASSPALRRILTVCAMRIESHK